MKAAKDERIVLHLDLANTKADLMFQTDELEREVTNLKTPPYLHTCGSRLTTLSTSHQTITYTSVLYSSTNTEGGGLDIKTGVFTAPRGGSYTVSWNTAAVMDHGEYVIIFLQKNDENIQESWHHSYYGGDSSHVIDQGNN